jgi:hypothetical protein
MSLTRTLVECLESACKALSVAEYHRRNDVFSRIFALSVFDLCLEQFTLFTSHMSILYHPVRYQIVNKDICNSSLPLANQLCASRPTARNDSTTLGFRLVSVFEYARKIDVRQYRRLEPKQPDWCIWDRPRLTQEGLTCLCDADVLW